MEDLDHVADSIMDQLKNGYSKEDIEKEYPELTSDQVEEFILKYGSKAVIDISDAITEVAQTVGQAGTEREIIALAELSRSLQGTLDMLQKRGIAREKNDTQVKIKEMDIESKKDNNENSSKDGNAIGMSREELFKAIRKTAVEAETISIEQKPIDAVDV